MNNNSEKFFSELQKTNLDQELLDEMWSKKLSSTDRVRVSVMALTQGLGGLLDVIAKDIQQNCLKSKRESHPLVDTIYLETIIHSAEMVLNYKRRDKKSKGLVICKKFLQQIDSQNESFCKNCKKIDGCKYYIGEEK